MQSPTKALRAVAEAVGLNPDELQIREIVIRASTTQLPMIDVWMFMDVEGCGRLTEVIKQYQLTELNASEDAISA